MRNLYIIIFTLSFLFSCIKEELPIAPYEHNPEQVEMGPDYNNQIFYNLNYSSVVSENLETDWQIAFECSDSGSHVILNSSIVTKAFKTSSTNFNDVSSISGISSNDWLYDAPSGCLDSIALNPLGSLKKLQDFDVLLGNVYILNLGYSVSGDIDLGYKKIVVDKIDDDQYKIRSANLDGSKDTTVIINKDGELNFKAFSLSSNSTVEVFPNKNDWDLMFTAYTHIFDFNGSPLPYRVSGVLINRYKTYVAEDTTLDYNEINYNNIINNNNLVYSNNIDVIGYNWKTYSGSFTIVENLNYIIKTSAGLYFKLRFIDFYNDNGVKGCPKFEFQQLQT